MTRASNLCALEWVSKLHTDPDTKTFTLKRAISCQLVSAAQRDITHNLPTANTQGE